MNKPDITQVVSHLYEPRLMQLATLQDSKPWICTVYYVVDDSANVFWLSLPSRRHSIALAANPNAAAAIAVKHDKPVIGVQMEGRVGVVDDIDMIKTVLELYSAKYDAGHDFVENYMKGTNKHRLYQLIPSSIVLFDEQNYPENPRQIIDVNQ